MIICILFRCGFSSIYGTTRHKELRFKLGRKWIYTNMCKLSLNITLKYNFMWSILYYNSIYSMDMYWKTFHNITRTVFLICCTTYAECLLNCLSCLYFGVSTMKKDYDNILDCSTFKFGFKYDCLRQKPSADQNWIVFA